MIAFLRRAFAFPLLAKDLTERAAQRRTYVLRVAFGLLFAAFFASQYNSHDRSQYGDQRSLLGSGNAIFQTLKTLLVWAILLFQPALMAGVLTHEKERDTLSLLLLADMKPWRLLLQKFIGGLLPMFTLLLYALPLAAIAYSYGGVSGTDVFFAALVVCGAWMQVGALSLLCSAWYRSTTRATITALVLSIIVIPGVDYIGQTIREGRRSSRGSPALISAPAIIEHRSLGFDSVDEETYYIRIGDFVVPKEALQAIGFTYPLFLSAAIFLLLSRLVFIRRAFAPPDNVGRRVFAWLDRFFEELNRGFGSKTFLRGKDYSLPESQPILWRETSRGILGRPQHLVRLGFGLYIFVWFLTIFFLITGALGRVETSLGGIAIGITLLGIVCVASTACDSIGAERSRQTLEVLLTTPIAPREIVAQKLTAARRLGWVFIGNIYAIIAFVAALKISDGFGSWGPGNGADTAILGAAYPWFYIGCTLLALPMLFALVRWFAMWVGIRIRNRTRAFLTTLGVFALWILLPEITTIITRDTGSPVKWARVLSPVGVFHLNENAAFAGLTEREFDNHLSSEKLKYVISEGSTSDRVAHVIHGAAIAIGIQLGMIAFFRAAALRAAEIKLRQ